MRRDHVKNRHHCTISGHPVRVMENGAMTDKTPLPDRGWRGSPELWLDAAYDALIDKGVDAVKILPLANSLNLSRTSYYWFFKDRRALLLALLQRWEATTTEPLLEITKACAATEAEAILGVISIFLGDIGFDRRLELAVRAWAQQDADVADMLQEADAKRLLALRELLLRWGHGEEDADVRARTIYLVQIGYISMRITESVEERIQRVPYYVEVYSGQRPSADEMARFRARVTVPD